MNNKLFAIIILLGSMAFVNSNSAALRTHRAELKQEGTESFTAGEKYFGSKKYIEYLAGNFPLIISVPHGGHLKPAEIADRTGSVGRYDVNTQELARYIAGAIFDKTGKWPHIIFNRLHRIKLDANREIKRAACEDEIAEKAFNEFHAYIDSAEASVTRNFGTGLYIDLHAHNHNKQNLELGYLISKDDLALTDSEINKNGIINHCSIRHLAENPQFTLAQLLRGGSSLGAMFEKKGYPACPSDKQKDTGEEPYFDGGYNTELHSSIIDGTIDGIQIETNWSDVRDNDDNMKSFAAAFADVVVDYLKMHLFNNENNKFLLNISSGKSK